MRILHTSDWHLGRNFGPTPLLHDQQSFLDWLVDTARQEGVDLVVVAGDLYDRAIAPTEAVRMFRDTLRRLAEFTRVAAITGNHDGADRVNTYGELLDLSGVLLRGGYDALGEVIPLDLADGRLDLVLLPFLDPQAAPDDLPDPDAGDGGPDHTDGGDGDAFERRVRRTHHTVLAAACNAAAPRLEAPRSLAVAHAFVAGDGIETSDSERQLTIGGTGKVDAAVFAPFSYTALGHLHRPQHVSPTIRYSGTPLAYSFSEAHAKSITIVDMDAQGACTITEVPVPVGRPVLTVTGLMHDLLAATPTDAHRNSFVRAIVTDPGAVLDAKSRLSAVYPHVVEILLQPPATSGAGPVGAQHRAALSPAEVVDAFWLDTVGSEPDADERRLLHDALTTAQAALDGQVA